MTVKYPNAQSLRLGIVMRRSPGVTPWAKWSWRAVAVLPGASDARWKVMREEAGVTEYHAATLNLWLYQSDTEAYAHELGTVTPSVYVILREAVGEDPHGTGYDIAHVTVSPYEAQDYCDSGEEVVEKIPMPEAILAWVGEYVQAHHVEEPFIKRRRNKERVDRKDNGIGDHRIAQASDVYRAPKAKPAEAAE